MSDLSHLSDADLMAALAQMKQEQVGAIHQNESGGAPDSSRVVNPASGAQGSMQVMPATSKSPGYGVKPSNGTPEDTARAGRDYYAAMLNKYNDPTLAAVAYNWGPGNTDKWLESGADMSKLPDETLKYAMNFQKQTGEGQAQKQTPNTLTRQIGLTGRAFGHGVADALGVIGNPLNAAINKAGELIGHNPHLQDVDTTLKRLVDQLTPQPENTTEQVVGDLGAAVANPLNLLAGGIAGPARTVLGAMGKGAVAGGMSGLMQPVHGDDGLGDIAERAGMGAAGGALGGLATGVAGRVIGGVPILPEAKRMMERGLTPTPGQAMGGSAKMVEEKMGSFPFFNEAQDAALKQNTDKLNRVLYQDALAPIRGQLAKNVQTGSEGVADVSRQIGSVYDDIANNVPQVRLRGSFMNDVGRVRNELAQRAPGALQQFDTILNNQIAGKLNGNALTGQQWGETRSYLSTVARENRMGNVTPDQRNLAQAMDDINDALTQQVGRQNPGVDQMLSNANKAWAKYKRIERAAGMQGAFNRGNVFTAAEYSNAARQGAADAQRATGSGLNGQVAQDAQQVLGRRYPDSGTPGRMLLNLGAAGAGGAVNPMVPLAMMSTLPLYGTDLGRRIMLGAMQGMRLPGVGDAMVGAAPVAGILSGAAASNRDRKK